MFVRVRNRFWINRRNSNHSHSLVTKPFGVVFSRLSIDSHNSISKNMVGPHDFLLHRSLRHFYKNCFIVYIWKFSFDFSKNICKKCYMRELIATNISNHSSGGWHFHHIHQGIKKGKSIIKVNAFEQKICRERSEETRITRTVNKILIDRAYVFISLEKNWI